MKFFIDRNVDMRIVRRLRNDYAWAIDDELTQAPYNATPDTSVIKMAMKKNAILLTQDRDFEKDEMKELVKQSAGVILIRLSRVPKDHWAEIIFAYTVRYQSELRGRLHVITP